MAKSAPLDPRDCLCLHTRRAARRLTQLFDEALRPSGLRITQFQLLAAVEAMQPVAQAPLADMLGTDSTTLTRNLAVVERDGLVALGRDKADRRENRISLTTSGRNRLHRAIPMWRKAHESLAEQVASTAAASQPPAARSPLGVRQMLAVLGGVEAS